MPYSVYLKKNEEKRLLRGHSWVYANEVARIEGKDKNGALAAVYASDGRYIGKGYLNHLSKILRTTRRCTANASRRRTPRGGG